MRRVSTFLLLAIVVAPALSQESLADRLRRSVHQIASMDEDGETFATGTAFAVHEPGWFVTNLHVLEGASSAVLEVDGRDVPLELWTASTGLDLAVLRARSSVGPGVEALTLRHPAPIGEKVWAVGYPKQLGFTVTAGIINGTRTWNELGEFFMQQRAEYDESSVWVQTDAVVNDGNSGGPLVDMEGNVVGVCTWSRRDGDSMYFAISASHVEELLGSLPGKPVGFTIVESAVRVLAAPARVIPSIPEVEMPEKVLHPRSFIRRTQSIVKACTCSFCDGDGRVERRVRSGTRGSGINRRYVYTTTTEPCERCESTGYASADRIRNVLGPFIDSVSRVDESRDPDDYDAQWTEWTEAIEGVYAISRLAGTALNHEFRQVANGNRDAVGETLWAVGPRFSHSLLPVTDPPLRAIKVGEGLVLLSVDADVENTGSSTYFVGGRFAGEWDLGIEGHRFFVVRGGFCCAVSE